MARLDSDGGVEEHGWGVDTTEEGGKKSKQQKKIEKNQRKYNRKKLKKRKGEGRREEEWRTPARTDKISEEDDMKEASLLDSYVLIIILFMTSISPACTRLDQRISRGMELK